MKTFRPMKNGEKRAFLWKRALEKEMINSRKYQKMMITKKNGGKIRKK